MSRPQRTLGDEPLLPLPQALLEAEDLLAQIGVPYPSREVLITALRCTACASYPPCMTRDGRGSQGLRPRTSDPCGNETDRP